MLRRVVPALLVILASVDVAHGDLLKPCSCGPDAPYASADAGLASCRAEALAGAPRCCARQGAEPTPTDPPFRICPAPRAPRDVPGAAVRLEAPRRTLLAPLPALRTPAPVDVAARRREEVHAPPRGGPWRLAPAGLSRFLI